MRQRCARCFTDIFQQGARGCDGRSVFDIKAFQRHCSKVLIQQSPTFIPRKTPVRTCGDDEGLAVTGSTSQRAILRGTFGNQTFCRANPRELVLQLRWFQIGQVKSPGRQFQPREADARSRRCNTGQKIALTRVQHLVVRQRSRRDDSRHLATNQPLRLFRIFHLIANGRPKTGVYQLLQIRIQLMPGKPGHRHRIL